MWNIKRNLDVILWEDIFVDERCFQAVQSTQNSNFSNYQLRHMFNGGYTTVIQQRLVSMRCALQFAGISRTHNTDFVNAFGANKLN